MEMNVYGYFYATERDTVSVFVKPEIACNITPFCQNPDNFNDSELCRNCTRWSNNLEVAIIRPDIWPED